YGSVESTEGGYVGGIAGQSESIVKNSYAMNYLAGDSLIGGITGFGTTIKDCTALPSFEKSADRQGSIAGHISSDSETHGMNLDAVSGNYYVNDKVAGIDNMSFVGRAEPIPYQTLISADSVPIGFNNIRVTFKVDDETINQQSLPYGSPLSKIELPVVPPYGGMYVKWEDFDRNAKLTAPLIISGNLVMIEKTLESDESYPGTEQPIALVSGNFMENNKLSASVSTNNMTATYEVSFTSDHDAEVGSLRLYSPFKKCELYGVDENGNETFITNKKKGSYIECKEGLKYSRYIVKNTSIIDKIKDKLNQYIK
ncbi:MAG: hypothetical protein K6G03_12265, partial [Lachnospiraceae bacterium]|nr:hypothetical protein [Lachnospiraceae bacterium]